MNQSSKAERAKGFADSFLARLLVALFLLLMLDSAVIAQKESGTSEWGKPKEVEILGYRQSAMEPCISLDGQFLFFNGDNAGDVPVKIFWARRLSENRFQLLGTLPGMRWTHRDMAPSLDLSNHLYFTTLRSFGQDAQSIYQGDFKRSEISPPSGVKGDISAGCGPKLFQTSFLINMDCGISPDGKLLVISRAKFHLGGGLPEQSQLILASRNSDGSFAVMRDSERFLKAVNSSALQYAPALSRDGLELYFTRFDISNFRTGIAHPIIMVAKRLSNASCFGEPEPLNTITGFAEAPSLSLDRKELFFHVRDGNLCKIYRVARSSRAD